MMHSDLAAFLAARPPLLARGPLCVVLAEDMVEVDSTLSHHLALGFRAIVLLAPEAPALPEPMADRVAVVRHAAPVDGPVTAAVTRIARAVPPGTWIHYTHNAEYLFFPFCEHRTVGEMLAFHAEERRESMPAVVVDLYAPDLAAHPLAVDRETACFDSRGYYALTRQDAAQGHAPLDRQVNVYGGLRWRFEEHVPWERRRIDRIALFRARKGLVLHEDYTTSEPELNTLQCPWHRNLTAVVASFRTAKALMLNPGSRRAIHSFGWYGSRRFDWSSRQLLNLGLMEPGQWF
jgi:hypothetical protein